MALRESHNPSDFMSGKTVPWKAYSVTVWLSKFVRAAIMWCPA